MSQRLRMFWLIGRGKLLRGRAPNVRLDLDKFFGNVGGQPLCFLVRSHEAR
jgi:hypothetical protein